MLKYLRRTTEELLGIRLFRRLPRGIDLLTDLNIAMPWYSIENIFDVGANVGQSVRQFVVNRQVSSIWCFEPATEPFRQLRQSVSDSRVRFFQIGFGATESTLSMIVEGKSSGFRVTTQTNSDSATESIQIKTLDGFCEENKVDSISFLKIDTEGFDLEVLKGGERLLDAGKIDIVQVEAGMHSGNTRHVPFADFRAFMEPKGYSLFAIYDQVGEFNKNPILRRCNPVFISRRLAKGKTN